MLAVILFWVGTYPEESKVASISLQSSIIQINKNSDRAAKRTYVPPTLIVYGKLVELTAGGSGKSAEGSHKTDPTKRP